MSEIILECPRCGYSHTPGDPMCEAIHSLNCNFAATVREKLAITDRLSACEKENGDLKAKLAEQLEFIQELGAKLNATKSREAGLESALKAIPDIARGLRPCRHGRTCCPENDNTVGAILEMVKALDVIVTPSPEAGKEKDAE